jgi:DNA-binding MarR family transcriptional regulator
MTPDLRSEIQQRKPFRSREEEATLNLVRTASLVTGALELLLKPYGISPAQYNVLRILRGAGPKGLGRNEIRSRLLARMPDVTRLLDRMERAGLVRRERDAEDRRCVPTYLTGRGRVLLEHLEDPIAESHRRQFGHLAAEQLRALIELLTLVRNYGGEA